MTCQTKSITDEHIHYIHLNTDRKIKSKSQISIMQIGLLHCKRLKRPQY